MSPLFRRNDCFFCQSAVPFSGTVKDFKCTSCGCWNRYNDRGEIVSDEPAMRDEHLNARSFAKRGSPSKDQLPNLYGPGPFCHSCQTNQMLQINLLSNYLPDSQSPEYEFRLQMLPAYRESLDTRYPPICESCMPLIEDEIHRKDQMARVQALGGWLSIGKERQRRASSEVKNPVKAGNDRTLFWWKVRGCLWVISTTFSLVWNISATFDLWYFDSFTFLRPMFPFIVVVSLLWAAWDPTYAKLKQAQRQSKQVRIQGKYIYRVLQVLVWISRLFCSTVFSILWFYPGHKTLSHLIGNKNFFRTMSCIEILSLIGSALVLRIHQPHQVRLVDTTAHKFDKFRAGTAARSAAPVPAPPSKLPAVASENDLLASLSLSSKPVILNPHNPVFGRPSLKGSSPVLKEETGGEDMDWVPTNPVSAFAGLAKFTSETEDLLRPQRFFAPEKTTGLEGMLECARIQDDLMVVDAPYTTQPWSNERLPTSMRHLWEWRVTFVFSLAAFVVSFIFAQQMTWSWQTKS